MTGQFLRFLGVGGVATLCHYAMLIGLVELGLTSPIAASGIGAVVGAVVSYALNRRVTFRSDAALRQTAPRFFTVALLAVVCNTGLMALFVAGIGVPYLPAQVVTTGLIVILTFGANKFWTFR